MDQDDALQARAVVNEAANASSPSRASVPIASCLGFTGTQEGCQANQRATLVLWLRRLHRCGYEWMRNGDCIGADEQAARAWIDMGGNIFLHPPTITAKRAFLPFDLSSTPRPYLDRNRDIVDGSAILLATPAQMIEVRRGGTWSTIRYAVARELPIVIIYPDGSYAGRNDIAKAIEARRAETLGSVHESAVPGKAFAPIPPAGPTPSETSAPQQPIPHDAEGVRDNQGG